ncbi:disulfide bond formation protein B [Candidatus Uhrbacteria bacterium]|nr:disulfide bond formation protein B [Candidatus Uhrbacteria bacterium]
MFIIALIAMLGSLFYSEIAGYEPCKLCWLQRIFMYPQTILMALAIAWRTGVIANACGVLSGIGAFIAGYHYLLQVGVVKGVECGAVGYSVACSKVFVMNYGYITIPLMAFSAFILIFLLSIIRKNFERSL